MHALFSQDGCQREEFWEAVGHMVSPFDLSRTLPVAGGLLVPCSLPGPPGKEQGTNKPPATGGLLVPCSLPGPPVIKQLMQMVTVVPGQGGRFQSVRFP